jgi:hypothetical protein
MVEHNELLNRWRITGIRDDHAEGLVTKAAAAGLW